jgi:hypothetical protein
LSPVIPIRATPTNQLPPPVTQQREVTAETHEGPVPSSTGDVNVESSSAVTTEAQDEESSSGDEKQSNPSSNDDADVESNTGDASAVENSWINLREKHT